MPGSDIAQMAHLMRRAGFGATRDELEERRKADMEPEPDADPSSPDYFREQSASVEKLFWGPTSVKLDGAGRMFVVIAPATAFRCTNGSRAMAVYRSPIGVDGMP